MIHRKQKGRVGQKKFTKILINFNHSDTLCEPIVWCKGINTDIYLIYTSNISVIYFTVRQYTYIHTHIYLN